MIWGEIAVGITTNHVHPKILRILIQTFRGAARVDIQPYP